MIGYVPRLWVNCSGRLEVDRKRGSQNLSYSITILVLKFTFGYTVWDHRLIQMITHSLAKYGMHAAWISILKMRRETWSVHVGTLNTILVYWFTDLLRFELLLQWTNWGIMGFEYSTFGPIFSVFGYFGHCAKCQNLIGSRKYTTRKIEPNCNALRIHNGVSTYICVISDVEIGNAHCLTGK
jgi:hypothetical protein